MYGLRIWLAFLLWTTVNLPVYSLPGNPDVKRHTLAFYEYGLLYHQGVGIDADVVRELERRSGMTFSTSVLARARIWKDLESGNLDMTVSGISTPEREKFAWFIPYFSMKNYVLTSKTSVRILKPQDFLDHSSWIFGAVASFRHGNLQDNFLENLRDLRRVEEAPEAVTLFQKLKAGRIQGMFSQPPVYRYYLRELGMESSVNLGDWFPEEEKIPHGLVLSRKRIGITEFRYWQGLIEAMRDDGTLEKIFIRHLGEQAGRELSVAP